MKNPKSLARLLSDECVPEILNKFLEKSSIQIFRVKDLDLRGMPDQSIYEKASELKLAIMTMDVKFASELYQKFQYNRGIILVRHKGRVDENLLLSFKNFIRKDLVKIKNKITIIDQQKYQTIRLSNTT